MKDGKILIIDDDKYVCDTLKAILETKSYNVIIANEGQRGLEIAQTHQPKLILLDIKLPDMDGFDVLTKIKDNETTKNIPIVMVSGREDYSALAKARGLMSDDYIIKPFTSEDLFKKIEKYL